MRTTKKNFYYPKVLKTGMNPDPDPDQLMLIQVRIALWKDLQLLMKALITN